ncbi:DNA-binding transcriptional regulator, LysR family [Sanguibacter gelidistatuariae]|uniref:DNA-binding transcriptional regulator, LysR family n=1 Tax=Sanguibacter gelidistatuariae TaxID=1814289 RepID=A0A1G6WGP9_9MICO|nr:LysR family transcriptional regulator [Sanguibacter gelidistatuariae]SDD64255.1 DNA-binding transcriptional regulator, LysR family [Sanguibacter gelidistatuariae]
MADERINKRAQRASLAALEVLIASDTHGSISAAARALGLSQPSASATLRRLERDLGLELLTRASRGATLTDAGRAVAAWAQTVLAASDRFEQGVAALRTAPTPRVRLAASLTIAEHLVPRWLTQIGADTNRRPDVELIVRNSHDVMDLVLADDADLGFVEGTSVRRGLRSRTIMRDTLVVLVGPQHPWARRRAARASLAELVAARLVIREEGSGTRDILVRALAAAGAQLPDHLPHLGSTAALKTAVQYSDAVTVLSELAVAEDLDRGSLIRIEVPGLALDRRLRLVWKDGAELSAPVREIAALVTAPRAG